MTKSLKTDSRPLEKKPGMSLKDLLNAVTVGNRDDDLFSSLANRLVRLDRIITDKEKQIIRDQTNGISLNQLASNLFKAYDPDTIEEIQIEVNKTMKGQAPDDIERAIRENMQLL